jgi:hypothetical protein
MLRRSVFDHDAASARPGDTRPMTAATVAPPSRPGSGGAERTGVADRLRAAGIHFGLSTAAALPVLAVVLLAWYPGPLPALLGVGAILLIMLGVDVVLGPLFTLIVFDRRKKRLAWDLATIAAVQIGALLYGLFTVYQGRPAFVVFVKDRFEVISPADLRPDARAAARGNPPARIDPLGPRWVAARLPESAAERSAILFEALAHNRDVQHHPRLYVDYADEAAQVLARALPVERLRALNPARLAQVDAEVAATGQSAAALRYLPLRGPARDGAVLVDAADGRVRRVTDLAPW